MEEEGLARDAALKEEAAPRKEAVGEPLLVKKATLREEQAKEAALKEGLTYEQRVEAWIERL